MRDSEHAIQAAMTGNAPALAALLTKDPGLLQAEDEWGYPLLMVAARYGFSGRTTKNRAVVELILERMGGADIFAASFLDMPERAAELLAADPSLARAAEPKPGWLAGMTPLHYAADRGSVAVARLLLDHGADPNARSRRGELPISLAAHAGPMKPCPAEDVIQLLEERGAEVDLTLAATLGDSERVERILNAHPDRVNVPDEEGATPLFHAARNLHLKTARLLLKRGANVDARRSDGLTSAAAAVGHMWDEGGPEMVRTLRKAGATLDLYEAARLGDAPRVAEILAGDPEQVAMTRWGDTPIEAAAWQGLTEIGRMLQAAGAEVTIHVAAALGLEAEARRLLAEDPDLLHARGKSGGHTPLHRAAEAGQVAMVRLLLLHGADVNARTEWGATPLFLVAAPWGRSPRACDADVARVLLERGADPSAAEGHHGSTPLHGAVHTGNLDVARALLKDGADPLRRNKSGQTPARLAEKRGLADMAALLREAESTAARNVDSA